jgi:hypothetical protein
MCQSLQEINSVACLHSNNTKRPVQAQTRFVSKRALKTSVMPADKPGGVTPFRDMLLALTNDSLGNGFNQNARVGRVIALRCSAPHPVPFLTPAERGRSTICQTSQAGNARRRSRAKKASIKKLVNGRSIFKTVSVNPVAHNRA